MQSSTLFPPESLQVSPGYSLPEWIKILGLLAGIGAIPLLARLPQLARWYWAVGLGAGLLLVCFGLYYLVRYVRQKRAEQRAANPNQVLVEGELHGRGIRVFTRRQRQAGEAPNALAGKLVAVQAMANAGLISVNEAHLQSQRLQAILQPGVSANLSAQSELQALQALHSAGLVSEPAYRDQLAALARDAPHARSDQLGAIRQATILISLGVFILLPAISGLLLQAAQIENAPLVAAYLGGPALVLWAIFEGLSFYGYRKQSRAGVGGILGMVRCSLQVLAALLIWIYLGLAYGTTWSIWLFAAGAALALLGAVLATIMSLQERRMRRRAALQEAGMSGPVGFDAGKAHVGQAESAPGPYEVAEDLQPPPASSPYETVGIPSETAQPAGQILEQPGQFQIFVGKDGQFYFRLRAADGDILLASEGYTTLAGCQNGVRSVQHNAPLSERYDRRLAVNGLSYFVLKAANHRVIGRSELYPTPAGCDQGIAAMMAAAPQAVVTQEVSEGGDGSAIDRPVPPGEEAAGAIAPEHNLSASAGARQPVARRKAEGALGAIQIDSSNVSKKEQIIAASGKFQIYKGKNGQIYFRLRAANGEPILGSEGYTSKASCQNGVESVKENAPKAERYERRESSGGQAYFVLKAANQQVIGTSEMYSTAAARDKGIEAVMRAAPGAEVQEAE